MNNQLIKKYTPLWKGAGECGLSDAFLFPFNKEVVLWLPPNTSPSAKYVISFFDVEFGAMVNILVTDLLSNPTDRIVRISWFLNKLQVNIADQFTLADVKGKCIDMRLRIEDTGTAPFTYIDQGSLGRFNFCEELDCYDPFIKVEYNLECNQPDPYTLYLSGAFVRLPLTLEDEVNAIRPDGRSKRVYSRFQTAKELRLRPLALATHELLEGVLNLNSYEVDGFEVSPVSGAVYTFSDVGIGRYSGRIALVVGAEVKREKCCCCTYRVEVDCEIPVYFDLFEQIVVSDWGNTSTFNYGIYFKVGDDDFLFGASISTPFVTYTREQFIEALAASYATNNLEQYFTYEIVDDKVEMCWINPVSCIIGLAEFRNNLALPSTAVTSVDFSSGIDFVGGIEYIGETCFNFQENTSVTNQYIQSAIFAPTTLQVFIDGSWTTIPSEQIVDGVWTLETCDTITAARIVDEEGNVIETLEVQCL
jgi:hypothetical protein